MRLNLVRRQQIIDLRNQGMTRAQIAQQLGVSVNLIGSYLHQLIRDGLVERISKVEGVRRNKHVAHKVDVRQARQMRQDGKSYAEIAKRFGVSESIIPHLIGPSDRITPLQQQLIKLRLQGLTMKAIAARLGKHEGTVAVILSRLVKKGVLPKVSGK